jgi:hypothetical protein
MKIRPVGPEQAVERADGQTDLTKLQSLFGIWRKRLSRYVIEANMLRKYLRIRRRMKLEQFRPRSVYHPMFKTNIKIFCFGVQDRFP